MAQFGLQVSNGFAVRRMTDAGERTLRILAVFDVPAIPIGGDPVDFTVDLSGADYDGVPFFLFEAAGRGQARSVADAVPPFEVAAPAGAIRIRARGLPGTLYVGVT